MSLVMVSWRGKEIGLEICRSEEQAEELRKRWNGGPVVIERIFEIVSPSSTAARCDLANRVLKLCGESLRLDRSKSPEELSAELQSLSADAPPAPIRPEAYIAPPELRAMAANVLEGYERINPDFVALYPDVGQYLEASRAKLERVAAGEPIDASEDPGVHAAMFVRALHQCAKLVSGEPGEDRPRPSDTIDAVFEDDDQGPMVAAMEGQSHDPRALTGAEKAELARQVRQQEVEALRADPTQLTGDQKRALSMSGGLVKSRPRQPLADQGIDPTQLTGAQKRALTQRPRRNEVIVAPVDPNVLTEAERSELSMLRAAQGALAWERVAGESEERSELRARRAWTRPTNQGQPPAA